MIRGIGIDIVDIQRIEESVKKYNRQFLEKIFTTLEIAYCTSKQNPYGHFAARFAAKEAVAKALSTGWGGGFRWKDVEVSNDSAGKPAVRLSGDLKKLLEGNSILLSLSHSDTTVVAVAIIIEER
jgi:holo-[acyl-carrier protein] synthase